MIRITTAASQTSPASPPLWSKLVIPAALLYLISPVDFVPDVILGFGQLEAPVEAVEVGYGRHRSLLLVRIWRIGGQFRRIGRLPFSFILIDGGDVEDR